jgi:hypothetical protein
MLPVGIVSVPLTDKALPIVTVVAFSVPTVVVPVIVGLAIVGVFIVGLVSILFVSVWLSLVPTIVPVGAAFVHALLPVPVLINKFVPLGVLLPIPSFVSTAMTASFWTPCPLARLGELVSSLALGLGSDDPLSRLVG